MFNKKEKQFREAYANYYPIVYNAIYSRIRNVADSEDVCHDLFITFYDKIETIEEPRRWLLASVKYKILEFYKSKKKNDVVDVEALENDMNLAFENGARDMRIIINETIDNPATYGSEKEKIIFDLIARNEYTIEEAGQLLGLTRRQAKYIYGKASHNILQALQEKGIRDIEDML